MSQLQKMVKHTQTIRRHLPTNCSSVFDHFVGLVLKGLKSARSKLLTLVNSFLDKLLHLNISYMDKFSMLTKLWKLWSIAEWHHTKEISVEAPFSNYFAFTTDQLTNTTLYIQIHILFLNLALKIVPDHNDDRHCTKDVFH